EDTVRVVEVISGGPSSKVGVLPGDRIVGVNDSIIAGVGVVNSTVMNLLRGEKNSKVRVGVVRDGFDKNLEFEITRGDIPIFSVDVSYMIDPETGFIKVSRFANKTYEEFMEGMEKVSNLGAKKVIVDLRQNPGGSLTAVLQILNEFLDKGEPILYTEGVKQPRKTYNASGHNAWKNIQLYILIDEFSASASEIMAGAIQDSDRGIIIGRRSFGKGLVQEQIPLMDGSALRLTVARFYTPSGRCIQSSYENGTEEYYNKIYERFHNMEQLHADSIHFADSLKYETKSGRTVYGGGGIMPDFFVPADTTGNSEYFTKIYRKGLIYSFAYAYADQHRDVLSAFTNADEIEKYLDGKNVLNEFVRYAAEKGVPREEKGLKESGLIIGTQMKAYIARNIIGEEGFYPIIKKVDKTLLQAIEITHKNLLVENITKPESISDLPQLK
ncbi:MAG: S41 family peptidase, partial [Thiothrix litoralis]